MNLYVIAEYLTNGFNIASLNYLTLPSMLFGILVIVSKNPIVSVLFLIGLFLAISVYLMLLGINFIGLSYLLVYVGAISILFLFILMLINIRISEIVGLSSNSIPLAIVIGSLFFSTVYKALPLALLQREREHIATEYSWVNTVLPKALEQDDFAETEVILEELSHHLINARASITEFKNQIIDLVTGNDWETVLLDTSHITSLGNILYTSFPLLILLTSLVLLLAMVGCIVITLRY